MPYPNGIPRATLPGIDVSRYQQKIDWSALAASGVHFCFIKATEGARDVDASFQRHWQAARNAGLVRGAYHFFRPQLPVSAQADLFVRTVGQLAPGDLGPVLDLEGTAGWVAIPPANRGSLALQMLEIMERRLQATPIVYLSPWFATDMLQCDSTFARFPVWLAQYTSEPAPKVPKPWNTWTFWQHCQSGTTPGVSGFVDLNRFQGSLEDLGKMTVPRIVTAPANRNTTAPLSVT